MQTAARQKTVFKVYRVIPESAPRYAYVRVGEVRSVNWRNALKNAEGRFGHTRWLQVVFEGDTKVGCYETVEDWQEARQREAKEETAREMGRRREEARGTRVDRLVMLLGKVKLEPEEVDQMITSILSQSVPDDPSELLRALEDCYQREGDEDHKHSQWSARNEAYRRADIVKACRLSLEE